MKEYILRILVSFVLANFAASCISPASNYKLKTIKQTVESAVIHDMFWNEFHGLGAPNDRGADCLFALIRGLRSDGSVLKYKCYRINDSQDIYVKILESKTSYTLSRYDNEWMFHKNIKIKNDNSLLEIGRFYAPVNSDSVCRFLNNEFLTSNQRVYLRNLLGIIDSYKDKVLGNEELKRKGDYIVGPASPFSPDRYVFDAANGLLYNVPMYFDERSFPHEAINILARSINYNALQSFEDLDATSTDVVDLLALHGEQIATLHIISKILLYGCHLGPLGQ